MRLVAPALALVLAAAPAWSRGTHEEPRSLPWRIGGPTGFTVDAAAFPDSLGSLLDVYVRIPPTTLAAMVADSLGVGRLLLSVQLRLPDGGRLPVSRQELQFTRQDSASGFGKVVVMRYPTRPGRHELKVRLEDELSRKPGLAYVGRAAHAAAELEGVIQVPRPQTERELSDLEFVWAEPDSGTGLFRHAGRLMLPNPERLYGLFASDLRAFFSAQGKPGVERPWHWVARVLDATGQAVAAQESTAAASRALDDLIHIDISTLPAGGYELELKAWQEGDAGALIRRARFSIAWQVATWQSNPRDVEDEVHLLFDADAEERFATLQPGEQERELEDYWKRRDPTPETAANEARDLFDQRVAEADRLYTRRGLMRGMFTDMGRVFIRYGEPTEVSHQVIPAGEETVLQVLQDLQISESRPTGEVHEKGLGGDQRPFEVWIYAPPVAPPLDADPEVRTVQRHKRLVFLFVDEQGLGHYTLRYSTE